MHRTEIEKMRRGESPDFQSPELQASFRHAKELLARMRTMSTYSDGFRELLEQLIPGIPRRPSSVRPSIATTATASASGTASTSMPAAPSSTADGSASATIPSSVPPYRSTRLITR